VQLKAQRLAALAQASFSLIAKFAGYLADGEKGQD
jgi:hypothetical protein